MSIQDAMSIQDIDEQCTESRQAAIHAEVHFGRDSSVGEFCSVGVPPRGRADGELPTVIGDRARVLSHAVIYAGNTIGDDFVAGHGAYIRESNTIGDRVEVGALGVWEGRVTVGNDVVFGPQTGVAELTTIGNGVVIGPQVGIAAVIHPLSPGAKDTAQGPTIGSGVTLGAAVCLGPGVQIGDGAYVEPGSVVIRDVAPYTVVAGNPSKPIGTVMELHPEVCARIAKFADVPAELLEAHRELFSSPTSDDPSH